MDNIKLNDSAAHAPDAVRNLAEKIVRAQGCEGILSRETSGYHLYIPCPECLHTHGRRELDDPKYSINLGMALGMDDAGDSGLSFMPAAVVAREERKQKGDFGSSVCMRTRSSPSPHRFAVSQLLHMSTVTERHPDIMTRASLRGGVGSAEREEMWEVDEESGLPCPPPPGELVKLSSLPGGHPAVEYMTGRGFSVAELEDQFRCRFCTREYPYGEKQIFYRKMPGGWKDTPQHRVVFHSMVDGAPATWQARVLEKVSADGLTKLMLHPYSGGFFPGANLPAVLRAVKSEPYDGDICVIHDPGRQGYWCHRWSATATRANQESPWIPMPPFDEERGGSLRFRPSKYRTAKYSSRQMMGWDSAMDRAAKDTDPVKWVVLCEGPLDAARVGPGGVALIGSSISVENAAKVVKNFHLVFLGFDSDKAGKDATKRVHDVLFRASRRDSIMSHAVALPIPEGKDLGDMSKADYDAMFSNALRRSRRFQ